MSMMLMVKAMRIRVGNPLRKLVLIKLADNANDLGECWPSHQHIADQCEISRRSVINHINKLEEMGLLRREYRTKNNEKQSNLYYLTLDGEGSAGDSLPSERDAPPSAGDSPPSAGDAPPPSAGDAHRTSHSSESVIEPVNESLKPKDRLIASGVDKQVLEDYLAVRKAKRSPLTHTAIDRLETEARKASLDLAEVVRICAERSWVGFNAGWNVNTPANQQPPIQNFNAQDYGKPVIPEKFRRG